MKETALDLANALKLLDQIGSSNDSTSYVLAARIISSVSTMESGERENWTASFISQYMVPFAAAYRHKRLDPKKASFSAVADLLLSSFGTIPSYRFFLAIPAGEGFVEFLAVVFETVCPELDRFNSLDPAVFQQACKELNDYSIIFFHLMPAHKDPLPPPFFNLPTTRSLHRKLAAIHRAEDRTSQSPNAFYARSPTFQDAVTGLDLMVQWVGGTVTPEDIRERSRQRGGGTMGFDCQCGDLIGYEIKEGVFVKECKVLRKGEEMMTCGRCKSIRYCSQVHQKLDWRYHKNVCFTPSYGLE